MLTRLNWLRMGLSGVHPLNGDKLGASITAGNFLISFVT